MTELTLTVKRCRNDCLNVRSNKGLEYSRRVTHKCLSQVLKGGVVTDDTGKRMYCQSHRSNFTTDPQCVTEFYVHEWKRERDDEETIDFNTEINSIRALRGKYIEEAREGKEILMIRVENIRRACLTLSFKTTIVLNQYVFEDIVLLPENVLDFLTRDRQNNNIKSVIFAVVDSVGQEKRRE